MEMATGQRIRKDLEERDTQYGKLSLDGSHPRQVRQNLPKQVLDNEGIDMDDPGSVTWIYYRREGVLAINLADANQSNE